VGVRHHQLAAAQAAAGELAQELGPNRFGLGHADLHAENLAPAVAVEANRDHDGDRDDAAAATKLQVGGVDPDVRPVALFDRTLEEGLHPDVNLVAEPRHLALQNAAHAHRLEHVPTEQVENPWM
jgi:hypothetical protein